MTTAQVDFWFTMGSTYSYLSVMRLAEAAHAAGVTFRWRPFHLLVILSDMKHVPFADKPAKMSYMWRDLARRAGLHGIPISVPAPYPLKDSAMANRIALVGMEQGWGADYVRAAYRRWFERGEPSGSEPNTTESLREIGQDPARVIAAAQSDAVHAKLLAETEAARELGIFGSPTFACGRELFWGDDRLEDAISWVRQGRVQRG